MAGRLVSCRALCKLLRQTRTPIPHCRILVHPTVRRWYTTDVRLQYGKFGLTMPQQHNLTRFFDNVFDQTGDQVCNWKDFERLLQNMKRYNQWQETDAEYKKCAEVQRGHWEAICKLLGKTPDDRITLNDFLESWAQVLSGKTSLNQIPTWACEVFDHMFDCLDRDGDGYIMVDDYRLFASAGRQDSVDTAAMTFKKIDADGDGKISKKHWQQLCSEYLFSEDPDKPGHYLFT